MEEDPVLNRRVPANLILIDRDTPLPARKVNRVETLEDDQMQFQLKLLKVREEKKIENL